LNANALFDNATASLKYAQAGLLVTAQNVSGAAIDGFVRRTPESLLATYSAESARPGQGIDGFGRNYSAFLQRQLLRQAGESAYTKTLSSTTTTLDKMLTDEATSIGKAMGSFFNAAGSLANEPANPAYRETLIGSARQLASRINTTSDVLQTMREDSARGLEDTLRQANDLMGQLGRVNAQIVNTPTPDLFDERDRLGMELQRLVGGSSVLESDGTLTHQIGGIQVVEGAGAYRFTNGDGSEPVLVRLPLADNIKLRAPSVGSQVGRMVDVFQRQASGSSEAAVSFIDRGQAGAYITLLNEELPAWQRSLDLMSADLVRQSNKVRGANGPIQPLFSFVDTPSGPNELAKAMGFVETWTPSAPATSVSTLTLPQATSTPVRGYSVFRNGVDTGAVVSADNRDRTLSLSQAITYNANDTIEFRGAVPGYLTLLESIQTPVRVISDSVTSAADPTDDKKLNLRAAANASVVGYKVFINGIDTGAQAITDDGSGTVGLDKAVTYSAGSSVEFRYPFNSTLYRSLNSGAFGSAKLQVQATSQDSQFVGFDATAAASLEGLRASFNTPVTAFTSSIANTLGGWNQELKLNQTLERTLSDQKASVSGVNLDEEAANLVRYQQLYAAASKMVQMGSQMFDTLLSMLSGR